MAKTNVQVSGYVMVLGSEKIPADKKAALLAAAEGKEKDIELTLGNQTLRGKLFMNKAGMLGCRFTAIQLSAENGVEFKVVTVDAKAKKVATKEEGPSLDGLMAE